MADDFRFTRDFSLILWKDTLWYNALRAVGAGLTFFILALVLGTEGSDVTPATFLLYPVFYVFILLPLGLVTSWFSFIPFIGLFSTFISFLVAIGDPWVLLLRKAAPHAVPVEHPPLFSLNVINFVLREKSSRVTA